MAGALTAIRFARENRRPFLGTCGGFQHAVVEFARNVLGWADADHAESNPGSARAVVAPLSCSLVGREGEVFIEPDSRLADAYGRATAIERYHCNYGLDGTYRKALEAAGLRVTATDAQRDVRAVELPDHPFFVATLFQPELSSPPGAPHPLAVALVRAAATAS